jgi:hypothetical protein
MGTMTFVQSVLLCCVGGDGKAETPAAQYDAIFARYVAETGAFRKEFEALKTDLERKAFAEERMPKPSRYAKEFLALADKYPKDPAALDALLWVAERAVIAPEHPEALTRLARDHLDSEKIIDLGFRLSRAPSTVGEKFLQAAAEKSTNRTVRAAASFDLACMTAHLAEWAPAVKRNPEDWTADYLDKEIVNRMRTGRSGSSSAWIGSTAM